MSHALATMHVDDEMTKIKTMSDAENSLLEKRQKKETIKLFIIILMLKMWDSMHYSVIVRTFPKLYVKSNYYCDNCIF